MLACLGLRELRSNDLFGRANQRAVGLIGRVRPRNSPFGRAQRGRTKKSAGAQRSAALVLLSGLVIEAFGYKRSYNVKIDLEFLSQCIGKVVSNTNS